MITHIAAKHLRNSQHPAGKRVREQGHRHRRRTQKPQSNSDELQCSRPIEFVPHPIFQRNDPESRLRRLSPLPDLNPPPERDDLPGLAFVNGFVSQPLLSPSEEESLFVWMNFHRFRAEQLRRRILRGKSSPRSAAQIQHDLQQAVRIRNRIASSNLRLVVSLAKKLAASLEEMSELISDGVLPLIRSVELFDVSLGNRFSTYATWAVRNQMLRSRNRSKQNSMKSGSMTELLIEEPSQEPTEAEVDEPDASLASHVQRMLDSLPDREQQVLRARFGLNGEPANQSLADVSKSVGLSKERVRQLVLKSLTELRARFPAAPGAA